MILNALQKCNRLKCSLTIQPVSCFDTVIHSTVAASVSLIILGVLKPTVMILSNNKNCLQRTAFTLLLCFFSLVKLHAQSPVISYFTPAEGGMFTRIDIHGQNLRRVHQVKFGNGSPTDFWQALSDTLLYAYPGADATSGAVTLISDSNTVTSLGGFTLIGPPVLHYFVPLQGHYGDTITLHGSNFRQISAVYFGDSAALSFVQLSDTVIKAVVANGSSGEVAVESEFGMAYKDSFAYTGPAITAFTPMGGPAGTVISIHGTYFSNITAVTIGALAASSFTVLADTLITATVPSAASGNVTIYSTNGTAYAPGFNIPVMNSFAPTRGTKGDTIVIRGFNFTGVTQVQFGGMNALSFAVISDTVIRAVPGYGFSGNITVVSGNNSASLPGFTWLAPAPKIISFNPASAGSGMTVTIRGRHFAETDRVTFGAVPAASFTVQSDTLLTAVVGTGRSGHLLVHNSFNLTDSVPGFNFYLHQPYIFSVTPSGGPVGTPVVIKGYLFDPVSSNNTIYFGAVKATVTGGNDSTIFVTVPAGASYAPVSLTRDWFTAYSPQPFLVTFAGAMNGFSNYSFAAPVNFKTPGTRPDKVTYGDFDNDGKTDVAVVYGSFGSVTNIVSVYRNTGGGDYIRFAAPVNFELGTQNNSGHAIKTADMDGDGKLDMVAVSTGDNTVRVLRNVSTPGNLGFIAAADVITSNPNGPEGTRPRNVAVSDFDGDDKPDIVVANFGLDNWCKITWMRNTSTRDSITFAAKQDYPVVDAYGVYTADLNNNQKPDITVAIRVNLSGMRQLNFFNNASMPGSIYFNQNESAGASNTLITYDIAFADFDNDGKTDIVSADGNANSISVLRNISSTNGSIAFEPAQVISLEGLLESQRVGGVTVSDMDGDGKPDIAAVTNYANTTIWLLKNKSTAGIIRFDTLQYYKVPADAQTIAAADLNNDGKPELITASRTDTSFSVLLNTVGRVAVCVSDTAKLTSNLTGNSYQWQVSTDGGNTFSDISNGSSYAGATAATLIIDISAALATNKYRCMVDGNKSNEYTLYFQNKWTGAANQFWNNAANWSCGVVPDINTNVWIASGPVVVDSNAACNTLIIQPNVNFTIAPGATLTVAH